METSTRRATSRRVVRYTSTHRAAAYLLGLGVVFPGVALATCTTTTAGDLCTTATCTVTGTHTIDDGCTLDFDALSPVVTSLTIDGTLKTASDGESFTILTETLSGGTGTLQARGGTLRIETTGDPTATPVEGDLTFGGLVDVRYGGHAMVLATGAATMTGEIDADGSTADPDGGAIEIRALEVTIEDSLHADGKPGGDGGEIILDASDGDIVVQQTGTHSVDGCGTGGVGRDGGRITLHASADVAVARPLTANGDLAGEGGEVRIIAGGTFTGTHNIHAKGTGGTSGADGGTITLYAAGGSINGDWSATGEDAGEGGTIRISMATGDLDLKSGGSLDVSSGADGTAGDVEIDVAFDALLNGTLKANAAGNSSTGGEIAVSAGDLLSVQATIEARSTATNADQEDAIIQLSGCTVDIDGHIKTRNGSGTGQIRIHYVKGLTATNMWLFADDDGGNLITCACEDDDDNGICDDATCASDPVLTNVDDDPDYELLAELPSICRL